MHYSRILLVAVLVEALTTPSTQNLLYSPAASPVGLQCLSLGMREHVDSFMSTQDSHLQLLKKKDCPRPLSSDDIQQVVIKIS